jgi:hypothetical protein
LKNIFVSIFLIVIGSILWLGTISQQPRETFAQSDYTFSSINDSLGGCSALSAERSNSSYIVEKILAYSSSRERRMAVKLFLLYPQQNKNTFRTRLKNNVFALRVIII